MSHDRYGRSHAAFPMPASHDASQLLPVTINSMSGTGEERCVLLLRFDESPPIPVQQTDEYG